MLHFDTDRDGKPPKYSLTNHLVEYLLSGSRSNNRKEENHQRAHITDAKFLVRILINQLGRTT